MPEKGRFPVKNMFPVKGVFFSWLTSYFAILLIPIVISTAVYIKAEDIIESEINRANQAVLKQARQVIDSRMQDVVRLAREIALNDKVKGILYAKKPLGELERFKIGEIVKKDLTMYSAMNGFVDTYYIYFKHGHYVLRPGAYYEPEVAYDEFQIYSSMSYQDWLRTLQNKYYHACLPLKKQASDGTAAKTIAYLQSLPVEGEQSAATLLILLDENQIRENIENIEWISRGAFLILDKDDQVIASNTAGGLPGLFLYSDLAQNEGMFYENAAEGKMVVSYISSKVMEWKYISVIPTAVFMEKAAYIKKLTLFSLFLCMTVGGMAAYFFTRKNYNPVGELVSTLKNRIKPSGEVARDEYSFIRESIYSTLLEKEEIGKRLELQNNEMRLSFLNRLLRGRVGSGVSIHDLLSNYRLQFDSDTFAVMLFKIEDYSGLFPGKEHGDEEEKRKLAEFAICNVVEELVRQNHQGYTTEINEMVACIISIKYCDRSLEKQELVKIARDAKKFADENLFISLTISISDPHETFAGIPIAYQEALEAMEYKMVMGSGEILGYEELKKPKRNYNYSMETEQQLINNIKAGDLEKAKSILDSVFTENFDKESLSVDFAKCLMFDLVSTMMKTVDEFSEVFDTKLWEEINPIQNLLHRETIMDMKACMEEILQCVCQYVQKEKKSHNIKLKNDLINFVKNNYQDENLSNTMIAEKFGLNPTYLSRFFKEQTGEGLLDFINKLRIDRAKQLLKSGNISIAETARKVGYYNNIALIRAFKKYEGITPGKFKEIL